MAFLQESGDRKFFYLDRYIGGNRDLKAWVYITVDNPATVTADGYFDSYTGPTPAPGDTIRVFEVENRNDLSTLLTVYELTVVDFAASDFYLPPELDIRTVRQVGALGNGVDSDQDALQAAATLGGSWYFPAGTYLVDRIRLTGSTDVHFILHDDAVIAQNSTREEPNALIDGQPITGETGSYTGRFTMRGGKLDGRRDLYGQDFIDIMEDLGVETDAGRFLFWIGIRIPNGNLSLRDIEIANFCAHPFQVEGADVLMDGIRVSNCGAGPRWKGLDRATLSNIVVDETGNGEAQIYPHNCILRLSNNVVVSNLVISRFQPTPFGREPGPNSFQIERCRNVDLSNIVITEYLGTTSGATKGIHFQSCQDINLANVTIDSADAAIVSRSSTNVVITDLTANGVRSSRAHTQAGVEIRSDGVSMTIGAGGTNPRAITSSRGVTLVRPVISGFRDGVSSLGELTLIEPRIYANARHGVVCGNAVNSRFHTPASQPSHTVIIGGAIERNSGVGLKVEGGTAEARGTRIRDNGQNSIDYAFSLRSGVTIDDSALVEDVALENCDLGDSQTGTVTLGASFVPAAGTAVGFTRDITAVTKGATTVLTMPGHTLGVDSDVTLAGFTGAFAALNGAHTVTANDNTSITIAVNSSGYAGEYVSGATAYEPQGYEAQIWLRNPQRIRTGQWIKIKNALGVGSHLTAKIVETPGSTAGLGGDQITIRAADPFTLASNASNTFTLTGTWSDAGTSVEGGEDGGEEEVATNKLLGESANAVVQIPGPTAIYYAAGNEWRVIVSVPTTQVPPYDTVRTSAAFTATLDDAALSYLACDIELIPSQTYALSAGGSSMTGKLLARGNRFAGLTRIVMEGILDGAGAVVFTDIHADSEVVIDDSVAGTNLSTSVSEKTLISGIPAGWVPVACRAKIVNAITGLTGSTVSIEVRNASGIHGGAAVGSFSALTAGTQLRSSLAPAPLASTGSVRVVCAGGSDNIPSGGSVRVTLLCRTPELDAYA